MAVRLPTSIDDKQRLKKFLKEIPIYQQLRHPCGFIGNAFHEKDGKWVRRTHCPRCREELKWIPLEEFIKRYVFNEE